MILSEIDRLIELHNERGELKENVEQTTPEIKKPAGNTRI